MAYTVSPEFQNFIGTWVLDLNSLNNFLAHPDATLKQTSLAPNEKKCLEEAYIDYQAYPPESAEKRIQIGVLVRSALICLGVESEEVKEFLSRIV